MRPLFYTWLALSAGCIDPLPAQSRACDCFARAPEGGVVLATVGETRITDVTLLRRLAGQGGLRKQFTSDKGLRTLLDDEVRFELLYNLAAARNLQDDPEVEDAARRTMVRKLLQRDLDPSAFDAALGEQALRAHYERHKEAYMQPEKRRYAQILLAPDASGRALAQSLIEGFAHAGGPSFAQLSGRYSLDTQVAHKGGETAFTTREELATTLGQSFADTVFEATPQQVWHEPVQSTRGWHVVKVIAVRAPLSRDFNEVREQIRERLMQTQRSTQFDSYVAEAQEQVPTMIFADRLKAFHERLDDAP